MTSIKSVAEVVAPGDAAAGTVGPPYACSIGGGCSGDDVSQSDGNSTAAISHPVSPVSGGRSTRSSRSSISMWSRSSTGSLVASIVNWDSLRLGHRIKPSFNHAHRINDVYLLSCFLDLAEVPDISCESTKLLMRTLKMLRACDFSNEDICSVLAHASAYFEDAYSLCGDNMDANEVGNVMALLIFIAHSYVQDETCRLRIWHKYLFAKYCNLEMLNAAVLRLLEIRNYILRLDAEDLAKRYACLLKASSDQRLRDSSSSPYSGSPSIAASSPCSSTNAGVSVSSESSGTRWRSDGEQPSSAARALDFTD